MCDSSICCSSSVTCDLKAFDSFGRDMSDHRSPFPRCREITSASTVHITWKKCDGFREQHVSRTVGSAPACFASCRHPEASKARTGRRSQRSQSGPQGKANVPPSCTLTAGEREEKKMHIHEDEVGSMVAAPPPVCSSPRDPKTRNRSHRYGRQSLLFYIISFCTVCATASLQHEFVTAACDSMQQRMQASSVSQSQHGRQLQTAEFHQAHNLSRFSSAYFMCSIG